MIWAVSLSTTNLIARSLTATLSLTGIRSLVDVSNLGGFGPPRGLTRASTWPWVDHSASGLGHATKVALFGLAFATATPHGLTSPRTTNSQAHSSKGTQSPPPHKVA